MTFASCFADYSITWQFLPTVFSWRSSLPVRYQMPSYCFSVSLRTRTVPVPGECSDNRRRCFSAVFRIGVILMYSSFLCKGSRLRPESCEDLCRLFCSPLVCGIKHYENSHRLFPIPLFYPLHSQAGG